MIRVANCSRYKGSSIDKEIRKGGIASVIETSPSVEARGTLELLSWLAVVQDRPS
jgi:hypothetical protein